MYSNIPDSVKEKYEQFMLQDVTGLVSIGGIAQFAQEHDKEISDVDMAEYMDWSVILDSDGVGGVGEEQFEWSVEELLDPDSGYDTQEARHVFQYFVNRRTDERRKFENGLSLVEMKFDSGWSRISKEQQFADKDDGWQPYVGPRGGVGWTDGDDVDYDMDSPPSNIDQDAVDEFLDSVDEEDREQAREELGLDQAGDGAEDGAEDGADSQSSVQDRQLADDERAVPFDRSYDFPVGDELVIDDKKYEIVDVEGSPSAGLGPDAGYAELDDGRVVSLFGDTDKDHIPDDVDEAVRLADVDGKIEQALPEPAGSKDPSDWSVDWTDHEPNTDRNEDRDLDKLDEREKEILMEEWKAAAPSEESVEEVAEVIEVNKQTTMTTHGQKLDRLVKAATGSEGEVRKGDFSDAEQPTAEEVEAFEIFMDASQEFFRQNYGEQDEIHRGLGDHANENVIQALADDYVEGGLDDVSFELRDNPASVWTTDEKMARSFDKGLIAHEDVDADEVIAQPEALMDVSHSGGPDWNEGEVNIDGWDREMTLDDFEVGSSGIGIEEVLEDPEDVVLRSGGRNAIRTMGNMVTSFAPPEMAEKFHTTLQDADLPEDIEDSRMMRQLADSYSLSDVLEFASKEADAVIDLREGESDWLHVASQQDDGGDDETATDDSEHGMQRRGEFTGSKSKRAAVLSDVSHDLDVDLPVENLNLTCEDAEDVDSGDTDPDRGIPERVVKVSGGEMADGWWESVYEDGVAGWKHAETGEFVPADEAPIEQDLQE